MNEIVNAKVMSIAKATILKEMSVNLRTAYISATDKISEGRAMVKEYDTVKSTLQKYKASLLPKQPASSSTFDVIDSRFVSTKDNRPFLLVNSGKFNLMKF